MVITNAITNAQHRPAVGAGLQARLPVLCAESFAAEFALKLTVTSFAPPHGLRVTNYYTGRLSHPAVGV